MGRKGNSTSQVAPSASPLLQRRGGERACCEPVPAAPPRRLPGVGHPARAGDSPPATEERSVKPSTHPPRRDPSRQPGSAAGEEGCCRQLPAPTGRDPHFLRGQPLAVAPTPNLLFLSQTPPLPRRYQGSASPPAARRKQPRVLRGPHPPQADITLHQRSADTPGATGSGPGRLWLPRAPASQPGTPRRALPCCSCSSSSVPWGCPRGSPARGRAPQWPVEPCTSSRGVPTGATVPTALEREIRWCLI